MADGAEAGPGAQVAGPAQDETKKRLRVPWRAWLRALHRDVGNMAVGLTVVYALSGIAVNHIADWEPSFVSYTETRELGAPLAGTDDEIADAVLARMGVAGPARDVYRAAPDDLQIVLDKRTLHVDAAKGRVTDEGQRPRFFLRVANWLHLNRGKKAWTKVADAYAAGLLFLAFSGIFLNPGRKGLFGRGGILVALGAAVPIAYVVLSGGPEHANGTKPPGLTAPGP
jgi:hypothetical protein